MPSWETVLDMMVAFGWERGLFTTVFLLLHFWVWRLYKGRLEDKQAEIDRLSEENQAYRDRFMKLVDDQFGFGAQELPPADDE